MKTYIFNYHDFSGIENINYDESVFTINYKIFIEHLSIFERLKNINIEDIDKIKDSKETYYCLTFDDGRKSNIYIARKLNELNLTGTFYIITNKIGQKNYMDTNDIQELTKLGMTIGSHTCTHRHLSKLDNLDLHTELEISKKKLEEITHAQISTVAYPGGFYNKNVINATIACNYQKARTIDIGININHSENRILSAINIKSYYSNKNIESIINKGYFYYFILFRQIILSKLKILLSKYNN